MIPMTEDDTVNNLKKMSDDRHQIYRRLEQINLRIDFLQTELAKQTRYLGATSHNMIELLESELQKLIEDGYALELQLNKIMSNLKQIRESERALIA